jgi:hypothetical protein
MRLQALRALELDRKCQTRYPYRDPPPELPRDRTLANNSRDRLEEEVSKTVQLVTLDRGAS